MVVVERTIQRAALVGQVIEDLTYVPLSVGRFEARLLDVKKAAQYKPGGYFVFSDLRPGDYTLEISGERFQTQQHPVRIPVASGQGEAPLFAQPGDNEFVVIAKAVNNNGNNGAGPRIQFDPVILPQPIRVGARVVAQGFAAHLTADLEAGRVFQARLDSVNGLAADSLVRIVRDDSVRLKFDPYYRLPIGVTSVVGKVVLEIAPEIPVEGAQVSLKKVNDAVVVWKKVGEVRIATVKVDEKAVVLGAEQDVQTATNARGDYTLYFNPGDFLKTAMLTVTLAGYRPASKKAEIKSDQRNKIDDIQILSAT